MTKRCGHCGRPAAHGTDWCNKHGARLLRVQLKADAREFEVRRVEYLTWVKELEVRWTNVGGSPGEFRKLVSEGRELEIAMWLDRAETGW